LPEERGRALTIERGRRGRGVERIRRRMEDGDGDVERQLGKAGDEGNKGKEGGSIKANRHLNSPTHPD